MKKAFIILFTLLSFSCYSQTGKVKLHITDSVIYAHNNYIEINTRLSNNQDSSFILFNYLAVSNPIALEENFHSRDVTTGLIIYIEDSFGKTIPMNYPLGEPLPEHPAETICPGTLKDTSGNEFIDKMIILKKKSAFMNKFCFDLYYSNATKGTYKLYLFYYSGDNIKNVVSKDDLQSLSKKYKASIYKGWIKSNKVKLIVK